MFTCDSQIDCLNLTLSTPGALYWVSTAWLRTQPRTYLRPLLIQQGNAAAVDPLRDGFDSSGYPPELVRPLYMYVLSGATLDGRSTELAIRFLTYVRGVQGQQILESHHFQAHFDPPSGVPLDLPPGFGPQPDGPPVVCR